MKLVVTLFVSLLLQLTVSSQTHSVLPAYISIKEALVNADVKTAAAKVSVLNAAVAASTSSKKSLLQQITAAANSLQTTQDLNQQRAAFAILSLHLYTWVKSEQLSADIIYQQYCPMKKAYWLSTEPVIKNPYYGKIMLSCGNITDTIKP